MIKEIAHLGLLEDAAITLDVAALQLSALDHPGVDIAPYAAMLQEIAEQLEARGRAARTPREQADALSEVLGGDFGFEGDRATYDDPANADLIDVLERRRGLPVSLSILYVAAARRLGWEAYALNTPGTCWSGSARKPRLCWSIRSQEGRSSTHRSSPACLLMPWGRGPAPSSEHLAPMSNRSVLVRLLMNQATRAEAAEDHARARMLYERMTEIAPGNGHGWWERARLELAEGSVAEARASLSAVLEVTRDPILRAHVMSALDALAGSGG
jgi:regulator of sirC expression with transglutaminase-like and TPR domain